jgi:cobalt-zinc-cadmium efflux system outer membrane protein
MTMRAREARARAAIVAVLAARGAAADDSRHISLREALHLSDASPAVRAVALEVERARAETRGAGLWPNPDLSFSRERTDATDRFANVSWALPWSGRLSLERAASRQGAVAAETRARQSLIEARARVREGFIDLLAAQERASALEGGLGRMDDLVRMLRAREAEGESSGFDLMRAVRERAEVEADLWEARGRLGAARAALAGLLVLPASDLVADGTLAGDSPLPTGAEVRAEATGRGDVASVDAEAAGQDALARAAGRRWIPEPALLAGWKSTETGGVTTSGNALGLSFSLNLFDHGQGAQAVAHAEALLLRTRREAAARMAEAEAEGALDIVRARREAEAAYGKGADAGGLIRIARAAYEGGESRILDLLDAYRTALAVSLRLVDLRVEARRAEIDLDRATGVERLFPERP